MVERTSRQGTSRGAYVLLAQVVLLALAAGGCTFHASASGHWYSGKPQPVRVPHRPPKAPQESARDCKAGSVWVYGYWDWQAKQWEWVAGRCRKPKPPGSVWVGPTLHESGDGYELTPGHWAPGSSGGETRDRGHEPDRTPDRDNHAAGGAPGDAPGDTADAKTPSKPNQRATDDTDRASEAAAGPHAHTAGGTGEPGKPTKPAAKPSNLGGGQGSASTDQPAQPGQPVKPRKPMKPQKPGSAGGAVAVDTADDDGAGTDTAVGADGKEQPAAQPSKRPVRPHEPAGSDDATDTAVRPRPPRPGHTVHVDNKPDDDRPLDRRPSKPATDRPSDSLRKPVIDVSKNPSKPSSTKPAQAGRSGSNDLRRGDAAATRADRASVEADLRNPAASFSCSLDVKHAQPGDTLTISTQGVDKEPGVYLGRQRLTVEKRTSSEVIVTLPDDAKRGGRITLVVGGTRQRCGRIALD